MTRPFITFVWKDDPHPFLWVGVKGMNTRNGINCG